VNVLETDRLVLRWLTPDDAPFILELLNDPDWIRFIGDRGVRTVEGAREYIEKGPAASYTRNGFGLYLTALKDSGESIGICGLIKRDTLEDVDVGFAFLPRYRGQGYALEAAAATMAYGRDPLGLTRIIAIATPDNESSLRLLRKLGLRFERMTRLPDDDTDLALYATGPNRAGRAPTPEIVVLEESQIEEAGSALARGFFDDPLSVYMLPVPMERATFLPLHFATAVRAGHLFGTVHTTRGTAQGVAMWFSPDRGLPSRDEWDQAGVSELRRMLPAGALDRSSFVIDYLHQFHKTDVLSKHWYLCILGVAPEIRGTGVGSALMQPMLRRADEEGLPCYLETFAADNVPFYEKHGFRVMRQGVEPESGIEYWTFVRPPREAGAG
jgi:RimJ/RimL family protein N-acetyltransferase